VINSATETGALKGGGLVSDAGKMALTKGLPARNGKETSSARLLGSPELRPCILDGFNGAASFGNPPDADTQ